MKEGYWKVYPSGLALLIILSALFGAAIHHRITPEGCDQASPNEEWLEQEEAEADMTCFPEGHMATSKDMRGCVNGSIERKLWEAKG